MSVPFAPTADRASPVRNAVHALHQQSEAARALLALYEDILGDDAQAKADAIEGETNLNEAIRRALMRIGEIECLVEGIEALAERLAKRKHRLEEQNKHIRVALLAALEACGMKHIESDVATLSRQSTPRKVIVTDEAAIPAQFWKRGDPKLDKNALLTALKVANEAGEKIPGAELSNSGETVSIRFA